MKEQVVPSISESNLKATFSKFGSVLEIKTAVNQGKPRSNKTSKGVFIGFVKMASYLQAYHAFSVINKAFGFGPLTVKV